MKVASTHAHEFSFAGQVIRSIHIHGQPWFVAKDVCQALGIRNVSDAVSRALRPEEKGIVSNDTLGGPQAVLLVSESGLYALIFQARKKEASEFRFWVTNEVLPALRKTGFYALGRERAEDRAHFELGRAKARIHLLRELQDLERDPKEGMEYLTVCQFLEQQGITLGNRSAMLKFSRQVYLTCQAIGEFPVKTYRPRSRIPATLWPLPVLRQCLSLLPAPQPELSLG